MLVHVCCVILTYNAPMGSAGSALLEVVLPFPPEQTFATMTGLHMCACVCVRPGPRLCVLVYVRVCVCRFAPRNCERTCGVKPCHGLTFLVLGFGAFSCHLDFSWVFYFLSWNFCERRKGALQ